ncbi:MAG: hypothetical protein JWR08_1159 [Enterovirga sp.]|jgi:hypothetical protein|nr:hypothetical protein [Enterovirga sp.]
MLFGTSLASFGLSAGGIVIFGHDVSPLLFEGLAVLGVLSAFVAICAGEARLSD